MPTTHPSGPIGVDLDNTIIAYGAAFHGLACDRGWITEDVPATKRAVRDAVRAQQSDLAWQELQGAVYGPMLGTAQLMPGVADFFNRCRSDGTEVVVVSHKTRFATVDPTHTDLRVAASRFLERHALLPREQIYFEGTRSEKVQRIGSLGCWCFIDDLEETFEHHAWPMHVERVLFDPHQTSKPGPWTVAQRWIEIQTLVAR